MSHRILTGLDNCLASPPSEIHGARIGLLMNQASVDHKFRYACDLIAERFPGQLKCLFSPQHGIWGEQQANMIESPDTRYAPLDLPVHSLYSETRRPTDTMLQDIDCLVIDLQDVGTRVYTFIWTMLECLRACAANGIRVVVLDRPNPLGGEVVEGPLLEPNYRSFVGGSEIPLRHGLTIGELAQLFNAEERIGAELSVVSMSGWKRRMLFSKTGLPWVAPSPNMPRFQTAALYPGQVLLEGTNLSEGRGTTMPFEVVGAPYLNAESLCTMLGRQEHPGIGLQPIRFRPTFDKWKDETCEGIAIHVLDAQAVRSASLTLSIIEAALQLAPQHFAWLSPPYEYEYEKPPIDILYGSSDLRQQQQTEKPFDTTAWQHRIAPHLLP
jgi:uncharacterized protein YbbC (DUF1343 family)